MKKIFILLIVLLYSRTVLPDDYQYQYFSEKQKYVPFSDYIPLIRLHYRTVPHYLEDYYQLYGMKQYYNENSLRKNIQRLETALNSKFRHPSQALVKTSSETEYLKYRKLMYMHINLLIMKNYLKIATRYDKIRINFHDRDFTEEILNSLDTAEELYKSAIPYWEKANSYAREASEIKITTDLGAIESERYSIFKKELDYNKIINNHLSKIDTKRHNLRSL